MTRFLYFMDIKFIPKRILNIMISPVKTWAVIHSENKSARDTAYKIVFPLSVLVAVAAAIGSFIFTHSQLSVVYSVFVGVKYLILITTVVYLSAIIFNTITHTLDLGRDYSISFRIIAYSLIPLLLCLIVSLVFESLFFINILAFYGLFIFWAGAERMLDPPAHKKVPMLIAASVTVIVLFISINWILTRVFDRIYFAFLA